MLYLCDCIVQGDPEATGADSLHSVSVMFTCPDFHFGDILGLTGDVGAEVPVKYIRAAAEINLKTENGLGSVYLLEHTAQMSRGIRTQNFKPLVIHCKCVLLHSPSSTLRL